MSSLRIRNPATGNMVLRTSTTGIRVLNDMKASKAKKTKAKKTKTTTTRKTVKTKKPKAKSNKGGNSEEVYLEADSASGGKFWEAKLNGSTWTVRWGRRGSDGITLVHEEESAEKASKKYHALLKQKYAKGYA